MTGDTERTSRYSDPLSERGGLVGRGAVLYDTRDAHAKPCCARPEGRCLAHVRGVYEETTTGEVYYDVADGTWTTQEWIHSDDLLAIFEPAGWSVTGIKPTYLLTREHGVEDHHDKMTDGGRCSADTERLNPKGRRVSDSHQVRAAVRGCGNCPSSQCRNVSPEWDGKKWVCPWCGYHFTDPPTFVESIQGRSLAPETDRSERGDQS